MNGGVAVLVIALLVGTLRALAQGTPIDRLAWLQGCWQAVSPRRVVEETWTAPRGGSMLGVSRTIRGDTLVEYELVVLRLRGSSLTYEAHPSGQRAAAFTAGTLTDSLVVFENPAHDFPQRVGYRRVGVDSLVAWIEGTSEGRVQRVDFPYVRLACGGR